MNTFKSISILLIEARCMYIPPIFQTRIVKIIVNDSCG